MKTYVARGRKPHDGRGGRGRREEGKREGEIETKEEMWETCLIDNVAGKSRKSSKGEKKRAVNSKGAKPNPNSIVSSILPMPESSEWECEQHISYANQSKETNAN